MCLSVINIRHNRLFTGLIRVLSFVILISIVNNTFASDVEPNLNDAVPITSDSIENHSDSKDILDTKAVDESQTNQPSYQIWILSLVIVLIIMLFIYNVVQFNRTEYQIHKIQEDLALINDLRSEANNINNEVIKLKDTFASASKDDLNLIQFPKDLNQKINEFTELITKYTKAVFQVINNDYKSSLEEIKDSMLVFKSMASDKSKELNEYKEGYDFIKQKNLLLEIIDLDIRTQAYKKKLSSSNDSKITEYFDALSKILSTSLLNNNIEEYSISIGTNVLENSECEPINEVELTNDENKINTVAEIISSGYRILLGDNKTKIIKKVKVKVYGKQ